jgi:hypothetical protein
MGYFRVAEVDMIREDVRPTRGSETDIWQKYSLSEAKAFGSREVVLI